jgi:hypothetical protein
VSKFAAPRVAKWSKSAVVAGLDCLRMPLEGHWKRINTPLRKTTRREGRLVAVFAALFAVALAVVLVLALRSGSTGGSACIDFTGTHAVGGATIHACGEDAKRWCESTAADRPDELGRGLRRECREAGYF